MIESYIGLYYIYVLPTLNISQDIFSNVVLVGPFGSTFKINDNGQKHHKIAHLL